MYSRPRWVQVPAVLRLKLSGQYWLLLRGDAGVSGFGARRRCFRGPAAPAVLEVRKIGHGIGRRDVSNIGDFLHAEDRVKLVPAGMPGIVDPAAANDDHVAGLQHTCFIEIAVVIGTGSPSDGHRRKHNRRENQRKQRADEPADGYP